MVKKKTPSTPIYLRPAKRPLTDAQRLARLEALVIDLMHAMEHVHHKGCDHEKWGLLMANHEPVIAALGAGVDAEVAGVMVPICRGGGGGCDYAGRCLIPSCRRRGRPGCCCCIV